MGGMASDERSEMLSNLECAIEHPNMTPEFVEVLTTSVVELEYRVETDVQIND